MIYQLRQQLQMIVEDQLHQTRSLSKHSSSNTSIQPPIPNATEKPKQIKIQKKQ